MLRNHTRGRNELELLLQTLGWTKALVVRALAIHEAERQCLLDSVTPEAYEQPRQRDSTWLSTAARSGWLIKA